MNAVKLAVCVVAIAVIAFVVGLLFETTPFPLDISMGIGLVYILPISLAVMFYGSLRSRTFLAVAAMLFVAISVAVVGDYAAYKWRFWGLEYADYGSDDMGGQTQLWLRLWSSLATALVLGAAVSLFAPNIRRWLGGKTNLAHPPHTSQ